MRIVIAGGSGFIGRALIARLEREGHKVLALSRHPAVHPELNALEWDPARPGLWAATLDGADALVNLAGESIAERRWSEARKLRILKSRVDATRALVDACARCAKPPRVLLNASAVGVYGDVPEGEVDETRPPGKGFLADVCACWEEAALRGKSCGMRVVLLRTGAVLGLGGGALQRMLLPFRLGLGGRLGSGRQWLPWIHLDDEVSALLHLLTAGEGGPYNLCAPEPVRNEEFSRALARALRRPCIARAPASLLRLGLGELSSVLLEGQRAVPRRLLASGFRFRHPRVDEALQELLA